MSSARVDARSWFEANWDPSLRLGDWWARLASSGWGFPWFPSAWFGRGLDAADGAAVEEERRAVGAAPAPSTIGAKVIAPLLIEFGTDEQRSRYLWDTVSGRAVWCELFSEPGAGSDLRSLSTRARLDDTGWVVDGQKVWTSGAPVARWGLLAARASEGITCFVLDMRSDGVEVRPLRVMTGEAKFSEVFLTGVRVPGNDIVGPAGDGWRVVKTTLALERRMIGALSDNNKLPALDRPAGELAEVEGRGQQRGALLSGAGAMPLVEALLARFGGSSDPLIRQEVARLYTLAAVARHTRARQVEGSAPLVRLLSGRVTIALRELANRLSGPSAMLSAPDAELAGIVQRLTLVSPSISIVVGTDEIQRNLIGERLLGLPPEPRLPPV